MSSSLCMPLLRRTGADCIAVLFSVYVASAQSTLNQSQPSSDPNQRHNLFVEPSGHDTAC